jgi:hypothetical protein
MCDLREMKSIRQNALFMQCKRSWIEMVISIFCAVFFSIFAHSAPAEIQVNIRVDTGSPGVIIPDNFSGLGFEAALLRPENGTRYFRPDNRPLINLFHTLGIKSLRVGGNTSDRDVRQLPSNADLDSLFAFSQAAGLKVIYCLRLHDGDPASDVQTVKYIMDHYGQQIDCFSIGQEPSAYPVEKTEARPNLDRMGTANEKYSYALYRESWKKFADVIIAAAPNVKFCGPSVHNNGEWARRFMEDFGHSDHVVLITEHLYPGGAGGKVPTPEMGRDRMLSDEAWGSNSFPRVYQRLYESFVPMALSNGLPYRLEEVNNYFNGGATNVSNTFASSLWGLDFMYWWAEHQAAGLNFHTGDRVAAGYSLLPSKYTAFYSTTNGYVVRPLGYGIKAFDLGCHGRFVPMTVSGSSNLNLSTYAVLGHDKNLYVTLINKEHGDDGRAATVMLAPGTNFTQGEIVSLIQSVGDVAATSGITLGGSGIESDGSWDGSWKPISADRTGAFSVTVPAASAVIVKLMPPEPNYDERKVGAYTLPDPLVLKNGKSVADAKTWTKKRRPEILKLYQDDIYGHNPARVPKMKFAVWDVDRHALDGKAVRKQIDISFPGHANPVLHVLLYTPSDAAGPVPTFLCLSFSGNEKITIDPGVRINKIWDGKKDVPFMPSVTDARGTSHSWKIPETLARGYGVAAVYYGDIEPDLGDGSGWRFGVRSLFLKPGQTNTAPDAWGAIGAWAWGASRVLDYLQTDKDVDKKHVILLGHSRLGKTALWAGAQDPRYCMVIASCSGEMGASLARRDYGETVTSMAKRLSYQFCRNFLAYSNHISAMPVDSHLLISLIAPRPLYLSTGSEDRWGDPRGEYLAAQAADPVYELFGLQGLNKDAFPPLDQPILRDIGFSCHTGKHDVLPADWDRFLNFADLHLKTKI